MRYLIVFVMFSLNLYSYRAKLIFIDNNFKNLKTNEIEKILYFDTKISFDIKKGKVFDLYRIIDKELSKKLKQKEHDEDTNEKKICIKRIKVVSGVKNIIKAVEFGECKNRDKFDKYVLGDFEYAKVGDFIEIHTVLDSKKDESSGNGDLADIFATLYMNAIDDNFNYLTEFNVQEKKKEEKIIKNKENNKENKRNLLPKKKKKRKIRRKPDFGEIRL